MHIAYEKVLMWLLLLFTVAAVLMLEKLMPHQSAAIVVISSIGIYGLLISAANFHHRRKVAKGSILPPVPADYEPQVSVVIPAHNEAAVIGDTVRSMLAMTYPHFDLWVFDDRSIDGTAQVLEALAQEYMGRFHYVVRPADATPGKSAVLNDALMRVPGEVLVVFDADARVQPDFLTRALPYLADHGVGAVQARKVIMNPEVNTLTRCQYYEYILDAHYQVGRDIIRGAVELRGNGQLIKRTALHSVGGWTEDTITDDLDLSTKLHIAGWDVRYLRDVTVEEEAILRFKPLLRQRRRWAEGSLKRYLEHGFDMITSPHVSRRAMLDMLAYFLEFAFPLWLAIDLIVQVVNMFFGEWPSHLISSFIMIPVLVSFFISGLFEAIRIYQRVGVVKSLLLAIETGIFLAAIWLPVVMWITGKILFTRDEGPLNWGKTEHLGTQAMVQESRMERVKAFIQQWSSGTQTL